MKRKSLFCAALLAMTVFASTGGVRANTEYDNLRNAIQNASSAGYELQGNAETSAQALGTVANPDFTITGNGYSILAASESNVAGVVVSATNKLTIDNISSWGGFKKASNGGAILNGGTLNLSNMTFDNNSVEGTGNLFGGAINNGGGQIAKLENVKFKTNKAVSSNGDDIGGAINNAGRTIGDITGGSFEQNSVQASVGYLVKVQQKQNQMYSLKRQLLSQRNRLENLWN